MPAGRPTKYKAEYCDKVIEYFKEGYSIEEIALELDVFKSTLYAWMEKHKEFHDAIKKGLEYSQAWWQKTARTNLNNRNFQSALWYMNMKNRFKWRDAPVEDKSEEDKVVKIEVVYPENKKD